MTADLTQEPKVREALDDFAGQWSHHCEGECSACDKARAKVIAAIREAILAEARPQWRKQVLEEVREMAGTGYEHFSRWLDDQLQEVP